MITLSKIAKLAHVSVSTASKAFSMSAEVSEQTRQEIFQIAKDYGCFKKFYNAKYPKYVIAVICPEFHGRHYSAIVAALQEYLRERNCEMCVASTDFSEETERELLEYYHNYSNVDGIIMVGGKVPNADTYEIPMVSLIPNCRQNDGVVIRVDLSRAIGEIVERFVSCGVKDIAFIGEKLTAGKQKSFCAAMEQAGLPCDRVVIGDRFEQGGYQSMQQLLKTGKPPRAVICAYDHLAIGAMKCIHRQGLSVPGDIAVVGMDNLPEAEYLSPGLSSIDFCIGETCMQAADSIVNLLGGREVAACVNYPARFIARESSQINE